MDAIPTTYITPAAHDLLLAVCRQLEINEKQNEVIADLGGREPGTELALVESLFNPRVEKSNRANHVVAFYKTIRYERKLIKIQVTPGTYILQAKRRSQMSEHSSITSESTETSATPESISKISSTYVELIAKVNEPPPDLEMDEINAERAAPVKSGDNAEEEGTEEEEEAEEEGGEEEEGTEEKQYDASQVNLHAISIPLTDGEAREMSVERYVYVLRCRDLEATSLSAVQRDEAPPITSFFETGIILFPTLVCSRALIIKVYQPLLAYLSHRSANVGPDLEDDSGIDDASDPTSRVAERLPSATANICTTGVAEGEVEKVAQVATGEAQRLRDEFAVNMQKFQSVLTEIESALHGVFQLPEPDFPLPTMQQCLAGLPSEQFELFRSLVDSWNANIDKTINDLNKPRPVTVGPLEEIEYWRYRCKTLTTVNEALRSKEAMEVAERWNALPNPDAAHFDRIAEIRGLMMEAKDNARFLLLVERHFKNVQFAHSFNMVADTVPAMLQSLRLIWTISRGYNKDERMGPLLQKIAWSLYDRIIRVMHIPTLFSRSVQGILHETGAAVRMLTMFESTYMQERQRVEATSQDNRWEFDRKLLFGRIHYVTRVLRDILDMANCAKEFYRMFGPELKNITGESKSLTEVLRLVDNLFNPLKNPNIKCPFLIQNEKFWNRLKEEFADKVSLIDAKAKNFINDYFAHIRGANNAFNLLERFKAVKARRAISCLLKDKYRDVLRSLGVELSRMERRFMENKDHPQNEHYIPPVSGAIRWARLISNTVKYSIVRFLHSQPELFEEEEEAEVDAGIEEEMTQNQGAGDQRDRERNEAEVGRERGQSVRQQYVELAHKLRDFEVEKLRGWESDVVTSLNARLSQSILFKNPTVVPFHKVAVNIKPPPTWWAGAPPPDLELSESFSHRNSAAFANSTFLRSTIDPFKPASAIGTNAIGINEDIVKRYPTFSLQKPSIYEENLGYELAPVYEVNFDSNVWTAIAEAARLEMLGVRIPEMARLLGLRRRYFQLLVQRLQDIVDRYEAVRRNLTPIKAALLQHTLQDFVSHFDRGVNYLNWDSLAIGDFLESAEKKIQLLEVQLKEITKCFASLDQACRKIKRMNLFKEQSRAVLVSAKEFFDHAEMARENDMEELATTTQNNLTNALGKLEEALFDTSTHRCEQMESVYLMFEQGVLEALVNMVLMNTWHLVERLGGIKPVFHIDVLLANSDIVLYPTTGDLYKWMIQTIRGCTDSGRLRSSVAQLCIYGNSNPTPIRLQEKQMMLFSLFTSFSTLSHNSARFFVRWMHGTCIICPSTRGGDGERVVNINFSQELERCPQIYEPETAFNERVVKLNRIVIDFLRRLVLYAMLWHQDKMNVVEKWVHKKPRTTRDFEIRIMTLQNWAESLSRIIGPLRVVLAGAMGLRMGSFMNSVYTHLSDWLRIYLHYVHETAEQKYAGVMKLLLEKREVLKKKPVSLVQMKQLLSVMGELEGGMCEMVDECVADMTERYRLLCQYGDSEYLQQVPKEHWRSPTTLRRRWNAIVLRALEMTTNIAPMKAQFAIGVRDVVRDFKRRVMLFADDYKRTGPGTESRNLNNGQKSLVKFTKLSDSLEIERADLLSSERLLGLPISSYPELKTIRSELHKLKPIYELHTQQKTARQDWALVLWKDVNIKLIQTATQEFIDNLKVAPKKIRLLPCARKLYTDLKNFQESLLLFVYLKDEALRDRHWKQLMEKTGISFDIDPLTFTLEGVFAMELHHYSEVISIIVANAQRELVIEQSLEEIQHTWKEMKFTLTLYTKCKGQVCPVLGGLDDTTKVLEDNMLSLQSISGSRNATPFINTVRQWEKDLSTISDILEKWVIVQQKWMYLEAIFVAGDIANQLPNEAKRFQKLDATFRKATDRKLDTLMMLQNELEFCQKALNDYLDAKRNAFPRFYFISDDEMLSILGGKEVESIQEHIVKMFDNIKGYRYRQGGKSTIITAMVSCEEEVMPFNRPVYVVGKVEEWLLAQEAEMQRSNRLITKRALFSYCYKKSRVDWMLDFLGMVVLATTQIWFTWETEDVFKRMKTGQRRALKDFNRKLLEEISQIVRMVRGYLEPNVMKKLETVLILDVHAKDIIEGFIRDSIHDVEEFEWESQLRFYWALSLCLGGAPAGPAGTGKTESTKDLAKAMGLLCVVTNCGESMDYKSFGKLMMGLCRVGCWGCFDEFNRIEVSVLSVVTSQIQAIQTALKAKATIFQLGGQDTVLNSRIGYFITMNPGYAGRTELPESLKALFRPVVVIVPDLEYICEIMLFAQGFLTARELAKKLTTMYRLAKEQLSQQYHYDFGLRALKSVLSMAGGIRRADPENREDKLLMRALKDTNLPKFVHEDVPLFMGLVQDLFPGVDLVLHSSDPDLILAATTVLKFQRYSIIEEQLQKVIHLRDTLAVRHSVMLVGPTLGGKTTVLNILANSQRIMGLSTKLHTINPKDRSVNELYGTLDPASREWTDGLLSMIFRQINTPTEQNERRYIVFDGDVDALWIENMNSVMDDNRLLTLVNGERIKLQPYCALLFEVGDLRFASPATVSRCGMVYVDPKNLSYEAYWNAWIMSIHNENISEVLQFLFKKYVPQLMDLIFEGISPAGGFGGPKARRQHLSNESGKDGTPGGGAAAPTAGGGSGGGAVKDSSKTKKVIHVVPTSPMHTIIQFCALLSGQLDEGSEPGTDNWGKLPSFGEAGGLKSKASKDAALVAGALETTVEGAEMTAVETETSRTAAESSVFTMTSGGTGFGISTEEGTLESGLTARRETEISTTDLEPVLTYDSPDALEAVFLYCLFWAFGAPMYLRDQIILDEAIKALSGLGMYDEGEGMGFVAPGVIPCHSEYLFDYMFDLKELRWVEWRSLVPKYIHNNAVPYPEIVVPTVETVKLEWILKEMFLMNRPLIMVGETGTSKTATALSTIQSLNPDVTCSLVINFSSRTSSKDVLRSLNANVEKRAKGVYGPMPGKKLIVFIDDLNMPQEDEYGTQQPIALMRMILERGGLFEQGKDLVWRALKDMTYVGGMGPPGGGRRSLDPRFVSFFSIFHCLPPSADSLNKIFGSILNGHFAIGFSKKLQAILGDITSMSIETYFEIKNRLLPTPTKFHYTFNLRDISRVFQGMCQATPGRFKGPKKVLRLWRHEVLRCFHDRLINNVDQNIVEEIIESMLKKYCKEDMDYAMIDPIIFGEYWAAGTDEEVVFYEDMQDFDVCKAIAEELQVAYNEQVGNLNLVLFNDALNHLSIIHRILRLQGSHALLVGVSGSGKKALAKLAAFVAGIRTFEISLSKTYGEPELCEDIKRLYMQMAEDTDQYTFIFTDTHVRSEGFLEFVNNILTTGCLVSLFSEEDKDGVINNVWPKAEAALRAIGGVAANVTKETVWKWFARDCTSRLHMTLCMSPVGDDLRTRCRNFPGIVNCTTIDWFFPWPEQALYAVACSLIDPKDQIVPRKHWEAVIVNIVNIHISVKEASLEFKQQLRRDNYVTATNYIGFIEGYRKLLREKTEENEASQDRLKVGLEKLKETAKQIDELNTKMAIQKVVLEEKTLSCEELMKEIEESTKAATVKKTEAQAKSIEVAAQQKVITKEKGEAENALAEALPALEAAKRALDELEKADVTEFRAFATPPKPVQLVGECLCHVMSAAEISWKSARGLMADANFIGTLQTMDCEAIPQKNINAIKDLLSKRGIGYEEVRAASKAGGGFFKFILSVIGFYDVAKMIRPKRERVRALERELVKAVRELQMLTDQVNQLEDMLLTLRRQFAEAQSEMDRLRNEMNIMLRQLLAAEKLTTGLASEKIRWIETVAALQHGKKKLMGHCLLASAFLNYLGPFTQEFRTRLLYKNWFDNLVNDEIPMTEGFKVDELLTTEVEITTWNSQGLPPDELSIQNAILTTKGLKTPVCIDPQGQATNWLRVMEHNPRDEMRSIKIATLNDPMFLRTLENCIKLGVAIMFTSVEESIDPVLNNILSRDIRKDRGREVVILGDREVEYDQGFRLYMTTKLPNPRFSPNLFSHACIINYTVTPTGLEGQLLSALVKYEQKELEEKREHLIKSTSENKRILKELEDRLLLELATQTGNILDNWELIETLEKTKAKAVEVGRALEQATAISIDVDRQRNAYRPAARRGAILFFIIADLAMVDPMYQFSLSAFLQVFIKSLKRAMPNGSLPRRLENIKSTLTFLVFSYGCTAIFEEHKLLLSFQLAIRLQQDAKKLQPKELNYFIRGNLCLTDEYFPPPQPWISPAAWRDCLYLATFLPKKFGKLPESVAKHPVVWKKWYESETPEMEKLPGRYEKLAAFSRLCLLRTWRIDRVPSAISLFINAIMGHSYVAPPITLLNEALASTSPTIPIVLIVKPGSDPPAALTTLALNVDFGMSKIKYLSLGQGQEAAAESLFSSCMARGHWLVFQNCHLLLSYTSKLEKMLESAVNPHPDFRLWLTTEPVTTFPVGLLQIAYKVVMEPPSGLRQNIMGSLNKLDDTQFMASSHPKYRSIMFVLVFLHGILQERRRYGKLGWNVPYDFADADLLVSLLVIQKSLNETEESDAIKWPSIKYLIGEVMYGGRTIDNYDRRVLKTYMDEYFGDFLFDEFQPFHFYYDDNVDYMIPGEPNGVNDFRENFLTTVDVWPVHQRPNVFGLHANTAIGYAARFARSLWADLQNLLPETDNVAGIPDGAALSHAALGVNELLKEIEKAAKEEAKAAEQQESAEAEEDQEKPPTPPPPKEKKKKGARRTMRMSIPPLPTDGVLYGGGAEEAEESEEEAGEIEMEEGEEKWDLDDKEVKTEESSMTTPEDDSDDNTAVDEEEEEMAPGADKKTKFVSATTMTTSAGILCKDAVLDAMATSILSRLPMPFDVSGLRKKHMVGEISPTLVVLIQELDCFNLILREMRSSLRELQRAIAGEVGMSTELDDVAACLGRGSIPASWRRLVPATEKSLADWLQQLLQRHEQYKNWSNGGRSEPPVMWLSGLHLPQSYLTALVQKACRKNGWALDKCTMSTSVTDILPPDTATILMAPDVGCNVVGLYLEGSGWSVEEHSMVHQLPRMLIQELPVIRLTPIERHKLKLTGTVEVPVYVTSSRRNAMGEGYVTKLDMPTNKHNSFWILEGACIVLNTD
ncbi:Dynein heavy chain 10 axonemal [Taenia crassiceps]|uniref:Dynein heavy chain 10 axonemal n=1 Tax=Taenia crassiceps TaxID=6207 RepID=A0ABR4Q6J2_9CEST